MKRFATQWLAGIGLILIGSVAAAVAQDDAPVAVEEAAAEEEVITEPTPEQGVAPKPGDGSFSFLNEGDQPTINFVTIDGEVINNESLEGKLVVVDTWATWCPPCITTLPHMNDLYAEYGPKGVVFLGISFDESLDTLHQTIEELGIEWPQVYDGQRNLLGYWGPKVIPNVHILAPDGTVIFAGHTMSIDVAFHEALKEHLPEAYDPAKHIAAYQAEEQRRKKMEEERAKAAAKQREEIKSKGYKVGDTPTFSFTTIEGQEVSNETLRDKLVILDFWASWCGPCIASMPHMRDMQEKYADKGVQIIGISIDSDEGAFHKSRQDVGMPWMHTHDPDRKLADPFGVYGIPSTWILSPDGEILWVGHPMKIEQPLQDALQSHPPRIPEPVSSAGPK